MQKYYPSLMIVLMLLILGTSPTQDKSISDCVVNVPELQGSYVGKCKKGLANGKGTAKGKDQYIGRFKAGLPHGRGTYTWASGAVYSGAWKKGIREGYGEFTSKINGLDSTIAGFWHNNAYLDERKGFSLIPKRLGKTADYIVSYKRNVDRYRFMRLGEGNRLEIQFKRQGFIVEPLNFLIVNSSGILSYGSTWVLIDNIEFPFIAEMTYDFPAFSTTGNYIHLEIHYEIYSPGSWQIIMEHYVRNIIPDIQPDTL